MCGLCGIVVPSGEPVPELVLRRMTSALHRRGPDDEGYYLDAAGGCGLGHRRLSIIDLSGGHQPLSALDGAIQVVVNGEIYNYRTLREELRGRGAVFVTESDSEVVAHGYAIWGDDVFGRLDGMFAIALWDRRSRELRLARDRLGKKPLYYARVGPQRRRLIFGSELKALLEHPDLERTVDPTALAAFLTYECVPEDMGIIAGVHKLLPGYYAKFSASEGLFSTHEYWHLRFASAPDVPWVRSHNEADIAQRLRTLIVGATERRLMSDVPLGVFLSGGIDSSTVAAAMAQVVPASQIKTFSITFEDPSFDEGPHARKVAHHLGTDHHEQALSPDTMLDILPEVADFMCEPLGDASVLPTYLLSRFARQHVTVALGGDGGDELFLGYPTFLAQQLTGVLDRVLPEGSTRRLGAALASLGDFLPVSRRNFSFDFKVKRFAQGLGFAPEYRHQAWLGSFTPAQLRRVLSAELRDLALVRDPYATIGALERVSDPRDAFDAATLHYLRLYLGADVLVKVDRAAMACGLEVRAPLLDTALVEFAAALPARLKLRRGVTKYILKRAVEPWLPREIIRRPKKGFGVPIGAWLRGPLRHLAGDLLARDKLKREGLFDPDEVARLLGEHDRGTADHRKPLWTLLAFELWLERFGRTASQTESGAHRDVASRRRSS